MYTFQRLQWWCQEFPHKNFRQLVAVWDICDLILEPAYTFLTRNYMYARTYVYILQRFTLWQKCNEHCATFLVEPVTTFGTTTTSPGSQPPLLMPVATFGITTSTSRNQLPFWQPC